MQILVLVWHGNVNEEMVVIISFYILSFLRSLANSISLSHFASVIFIWNDNYLQSTIIRLLNIMINHSKATKHFARMDFKTCLLTIIIPNMYDFLQYVEWETLSIVSQNILHHIHIYLYKLNIRKWQKWAITPYFNDSSISLRSFQCIIWK